MNRRSFFKTLLSVAVVAATAPSKLFAAGAEKFHLWKKTLYFTIPKGTKKVTVMMTGGGGGGGSGRHSANSPVTGQPGIINPPVILCDIENGGRVAFTVTDGSSGKA